METGHFTDEDALLQAKNRYFDEKAIDLLAKASYTKRYKLIIAIFKEKWVNGREKPY